MIERTLSVLSEIVAGISGEVTKTKQLCYDCLQEAIRDALWVFTVFVHQPGEAEHASDGRGRPVRTGRYESLSVVWEVASMLEHVKGTIVRVSQI